MSPNITDDFFSSDNHIIKKYVLRKKMKQIENTRKENRVRQLAYDLWEVNGKKAGTDEQNWKEAEELLRPLYAKLFRPVDLMRTYLKSSFKKINKYNKL